jgi:hypothetical protein
MNPRLAPLAALSALALVTLMAASPAQAHTVSKNDPAGDAPKSLDIVHVVVSNTSKKIETWVTFSNLTGSGEVDQDYFGNSADLELSYGVEVWRKKGKLHTEVYKSDENGQGAHPCPGAVTTWNTTADVVHTVVPTSCMQKIHYKPLEVQLETEKARAEATADDVSTFAVARD